MIIEERIQDAMSKHTRKVFVLIGGFRSECLIAAVYTKLCVEYMNREDGV